jgi:nicotinamidase-related amidase
VKEALIVLDVISTFEHADGDALLESMRECRDSLQRALSAGRRRGDVIYVNDAQGNWDGDAPGHVARAIAARGGDMARELAPAPSDRFLFKPGYSAFEGTALSHLLADLGVTRLVLVGAATEMCVAQTAISARERGFQVTVLRDACATVDHENEEISLAYLEAVTGSVIVTVGDWLRTGRSVLR